MQYPNETSGPVTQYARIGTFSYEAASRNGYALPPSMTATNRSKYNLNDFNDDQSQKYYNNKRSSKNTNALTTSTTKNRLHQSCHDLRAAESSLTATAPTTRIFNNNSPAFQRLQPTPPVTNGAVDDAYATTNGSNAIPLDSHRWSRQRSSDSCNIANCGKILWVSRETVGVPVDNEYEAARTYAASKGYYFDREQNVRIRTNAKGLPYTPLPERKQDFLANQRAIEAVVPLVFNRRRESS